MKRVIPLMLSILLMIVLSGVVLAQKEKVAPAEKKEEAPAIKQITGEISAVDANANTVTVKKADKVVVLNVTARTKITIGKEKKTIADLKVGDRVRAKYKEEDGKNVAWSITEAPKAKAEPAKPAKPAPKK